MIVDSVGCSSPIHPLPHMGSEGLAARISKLEEELSGNDFLVKLEAISGEIKLYPLEERVDLWNQVHAQLSERCDRRRLWLTKANPDTILEVLSNMMHCPTIGAISRATLQTMFLGFLARFFVLDLEVWDQVRDDIKSRVKELDKHFKYLDKNHCGICLPISTCDVEFLRSFRNFLLPRGTTLPKPQESSQVSTSSDILSRLDTYKTLSDAQVRFDEDKFTEMMGPLKVDWQHMQEENRAEIAKGVLGRFAQFEPSKHLWEEIAEIVFMVLRGDAGYSMLATVMRCAYHCDTLLYDAHYRGIKGELLESFLPHFRDGLLTYFHILT